MIAGEVRRMVLGLAAAGAATVAGAQQGSPPAAGAPIAAPAPTCPPNGYARPWYGAFGDNDGILRGYEIASPCLAKETIAAADAVGMARFKPLGVKNVSRIRFGATGSIASDSGAPVPRSDIDFAISYVEPAVRVTVKDAAGKMSSRVVVDGRAWDEAAPGVAGKPAGSAAAASRAPLLRLTPVGAMMAIIEADGHATVTRNSGGVVLSGTSPYDGYAVTVVLDAKNLPVTAEVKAGGKVYAATFSDYKASWESPYLVPFPAHMTWTLNGKPYADLTVTRFHSNPYVVFPTPEQVAGRK